MRIFKTKRFNKIVTKEIEISDEELKIAAKEMNSGLFDANLGGNIFKKRIALEGRGKSGGARTIVCFKKDDKIFFLYAFAKNDRDNITDDEKDDLKEHAAYLLKMNDNEIKIAIRDGNLLEVK
jgi:hypothetical protein